MKKIFFLHFLTVLILNNSFAQTWTNYNTANTSTQISHYNENSCAVDSKGNIWFATDFGVSKFDGTVWINYANYNIPSFNTFTCIAVDNEDNKWFGTYVGVERFDGTNWTHYNFGNMLNDQVNTIAVDPEGNILVGTENYGPFIFDGNQMSEYIVPYGLIGARVNCIVVDKQGNSWFGSNLGVAKFDGKTWTKYNSANGLVYNDVNTIAIDSKNNKWFGTNRGISKFDGITWTSYTSLDGFPNDFVTTIAFDGSRNMWVGTENSGIMKFDGSNWTTYSTDNVLKSNYIHSVFYDSGTGLWVCTKSGALRFDGTSWTSFSNNGLADNKVNSLAIDNEGVKWFSTYSGVSKYDDNNWVTYTIADGILHDYTFKVFIDKKGNKWIGTINAISKFDGKVWTNYTYDVILSYVNIKDIAEDRYGNIWFASADFGILKFDGTKWKHYSQADGLLSDDTECLAFDSEGNLWIGTKSGVSKFDGTNFTNYHIADGLIAYRVRAIAIDADGNKWFGTDSGLSKFDGSKWTSYTKADGLAGNDISSISIDAEGIIWFGTSKGLSKFDGSKWTTYDYNNGLDFYLDVAIDEQGNKWISVFNHGILKLTDWGAGPLNLDNISVKGRVFNDLNSNGIKEINEPDLPMQIVKFDNFVTTTRNNGMFNMSLTQGLHTISYKSQQHWHSTTDTIYNITLKKGIRPDTLYFGVHAIENINDVSVTLTGSPTRVGFPSQYWIDYVNKGTVTQSGSVTLTIDPKISFTSAIPSADKISGNNVTWSFSNLVPQQEFQIRIITQMPVFDDIGENLNTIASINTGNADIYSADNSDTLNQRLTGSFDPNDKLVTPAGQGENHKVLSGQELTYTIRFQNTGTDTAFNVSIRDSLSTLVDISSFRLIASSHPVTFDLKTSNYLTFHFDNINLPDSNVNKSGSNGFVKYALKPKAGLEENSIVTNTAYIFFDFNPAIRTNNVLSTYVSKLLSRPEFPVVSSSVYPNPFNEITRISFANSHNDLFHVKLTDIRGQIMLEMNNKSGEQLVVDGSGLKTGLYFYILTNTRTGAYSTGKLIKY